MARKSYQELCQIINRGESVIINGTRYGPGSEPLPPQDVVDQMHKEMDSAGIANLDNIARGTIMTIERMKAEGQIPTSGWDRPAGSERPADVRQASGGKGGRKSAAKGNGGRTMQQQPKGPEADPGHPTIVEGETVEQFRELPGIEGEDEDLNGPGAESEGAGDVENYPPTQRPTDGSDVSQSGE